MLIHNKKFLELLYDETLNYIVNEPYTDEITKRTLFKPVTYPIDGTTIKCRVSKETIRPTETNGLTSVTEVLKIFTNPEVEIPAGSKIIISKDGNSAEYEQSGKSAKYESHQEIPVELWRVKA